MIHLNILRVEDVSSFRRLNVRLNYNFYFLILYLKLSFRLRNEMRPRVGKSKKMPNRKVGYYNPYPANTRFGVINAEANQEEINEVILNPDIAVVTDGDGLLTSSITTATEISYLSGATSNIQQQINNIEPVSLNNNIAVITNNTGGLTSSIVTATELSYVSGATSNIQAQINAIDVDGDFEAVTINPLTDGQCFTVNNSTDSQVLMTINTSTEVSTIKGDLVVQSITNGPVFAVKNSSGTPVAAIDTGANKAVFTIETSVQPVTNVNSAFSVQNVGNSKLIDVNTNSTTTTFGCNVISGPLTDGQCFTVQNVANDDLFNINSTTSTVNVLSNYYQVPQADGAIFSIFAANGTTPVVGINSSTSETVFRTNSTTVKPKDTDGSVFVVNPISGSSAFIVNTAGRGSGYVQCGQPLIVNQNVGIPVEVYDNGGNVIFQINDGPDNVYLLCPMEITPSVTGDGLVIQVNNAAQSVVGGVFNVNSSTSIGPIVKVTPDIDSTSIVSVTNASTTPIFNIDSTSGEVTTILNTLDDGYGNVSIIGGHGLLPLITVTNTLTSDEIVFEISHNNNISTLYNTIDDGTGNAYFYPSTDGDNFIVSNWSTNNAFMKLATSSGANTFYVFNSSGTPVISYDERSGKFSSQYNVLDDGVGNMTINPLTDGQCLTINNAVGNPLVMVNTDVTDYPLLTLQAQYGIDGLLLNVVNGNSTTIFWVDSATNTTNTLYNVLDDGSGDMVINCQNDSNVALTINSNASSTTDYTFQTGSSGFASFGRQLVINPLVDGTNFLVTNSGRGNNIFSIDTSAGSTAVESNCASNIIVPPTDGSVFVVYTSLGVGGAPTLTVNTGSAGVGAYLNIDAEVRPYTAGSLGVGDSSHYWLNVYSLNYPAISDRRTKTDIKDLNFGLDIINKLKPKSYTSIHDKKKHTGFIYDELENVFDSDKHAVLSKSKTSDGMNAVCYMELIAPMVKSIQELSSRVIYQDALIDNLSNNLARFNDLMMLMDQKINKLETELISARGSSPVMVEKSSLEYSSLEPAKASENPLKKSWF